MQYHKRVQFQSCLISLIASNQAVTGSWRFLCMKLVWLSSLNRVHRSRRRQGMSMDSFSYKRSYKRSYLGRCMQSQPSRKARGESKLLTQVVYLQFQQRMDLCVYGQVTFSDIAVLFARKILYWFKIVLCVDPSGWRIMYIPPRIGLVILFP